MARGAELSRGDCQLTAALAAEAGQATLTRFIEKCFQRDHVSALSMMLTATAMVRPITVWITRRTTCAPWKIYHTGTDGESQRICYSRSVERFGLCLVGCGRIAHRHAAAARALRPEMAIMFASRDLSRAERYRANYGGTASFGSYEDALRDPRVHGVLLCTPHNLHLEQALLAARYGKHLLIEKPLARSLDEADQMRTTAEMAGIVLMVGENFRFMPAFQRVESYLEAGAIGRLREIRLAARGDRVPTGWRLSRTAMGGGTLIDGGIHYISLLNQWGKRVELVCALSPPHSIEEMEGEDSVVLIARLAGGAVATLSNSLSTPGCFRTQWASVSGSQGSVLVDNLGRFLLLRTRTLTRLHFFRRDRRGHQAMLREFLAAIREARTPRMDGREGRRDLSVVMAAYQSIVERRPVEVEE